jgi:hypothetical protein
MPRAGPVAQPVVVSHPDLEEAMSSTTRPLDGRRVAAIAAITAVVARVVSIFLWPPDADASHAKMLATASDHHGAWTAATAVEVVAWIAAGCAVLACVPLARDRGRWPTRVGGWIYGASLLTLGFVGGAMNSVTGVIAREPDRSLMVRVQGDLSSPVLNAFVGLVLVGNLMLIVFAVGLVRARLTGWSYVVLSVLTVAGYALTADSSNHAVVLAGFRPLAATWLLLARLLAAPGGVDVRLRRGAVLTA